MKFSDYLEQKGLMEATLKLADTPKIKKAIMRHLKTKIDKARQRDPEIELGDKTSVIKLKQLTDEFAYALGTYTTIDPKGTMGFTGQYSSGQENQKGKKEVWRKDLGTSIIVINMINKLAMDTNAKSAIAKFEKELTDIAIKNI